MGHFVGVWVSGVLDAGGEHEYDEPTPKKQAVYRSFQEASWLLLLPWLLVVANGSAVECSRAGVGCPGCAGCAKLFCSLCMLQSVGLCENLSCNQFNDGGCSHFRLDAVRGHCGLYRSGDLDWAQMIDDHKGEIIGIMTDAYYLFKKKDPLSHINDLYDHAHEAVQVGWQAPRPHL